MLKWVFLGTKFFLCIPRIVQSCTRDSSVWEHPSLSKMVHDHEPPVLSSLPSALLNQEGFHSMSWTTRTLNPELLETRFKFRV